MNKIAVLMKVHKLTSGSMRNMLEKGAQDALPDESFPFDIYGNYVEPVTLPDKNVHDGTSTEPPKMTNNESHHI